MIDLITIEGEILKGKIVNRPNKFLLNLEVNGEIVPCRLVESGRLPKLIRPGIIASCIKRAGEKRKTVGDVLGVFKDSKWWLINTNLHRYIVEKILQLRLLDLPPYDEIIPEYTIEKSRIDFLLKGREKDILLEVKGVSLFEDGYGYYPDAPTRRGRKHIIELINALKEGYRCYILFLSIDKAKAIRINWKIDPEFGDLLVRASNVGVNPIAAGIRLTQIRSKFVISYIGSIPVDLEYREDVSRKRK